MALAITGAKKRIRPLWLRTKIGSQQRPLSIWGQLDSVVEVNDPGVGAKSEPIWPVELHKLDPHRAGAGVLTFKTSVQPDRPVGCLPDALRSGQPLGLVAGVREVVEHGLRRSPDPNLTVTVDHGFGFLPNRFPR
jgi:hypothetical protein